jgi:Flp pilus assembly protein TadG
MRRALFDSWKRFVRPLDNRGNVAIVAALAMGPLCVAGLGAADLARATSAKSQLQDALDAAALGAARTNATTDAQLKTYGDRYLKQNLNLSTDYKLAASDFKFGANGRVIGTAQVTVTPFIAGLVTGGTMAINASTEVVRADTKVEVALVLDTTGSMTEGDKLDDMKDAAQAFILKMKEASDKAIEPNSVKISIVPFANTVRVDGTAYRNSVWMDQAGASPINDEIFTTATGTQHANRFTLFTTVGTSWRGCVEMRKAPYDVQDTAPTVATPATLYTPYFAVDEPDSQTSGYGDDYQNDYVKDYSSGAGSSNWRVRQGLTNKYGNSKRDTITTSFGPNRGCGVSKLQRLSTNFTALIDVVDDLEAEGNTNIPMGLMWGWITVSPNAPFADGVPYGTAKYKKIIVLMTDGENTIAQRDTPNDGTYAGTGYIWQRRVLKADGVTPLDQGASSAQRTAALDARLKLLCDNIKAKDIEIYTIRVEVDTGTNELLKTCASGRDYFYDVHNSDTLTAVFESVAGQIAALHLSK